MTSVWLVVGWLLLGWSALYRYRLAVALTVAAIPFYLVRGKLFSVPTNVFEMAVLLTAAAALTQSWWRIAAQAAWRRLPVQLRWLLLGWVMAAALSVLISPELAVSLGIFKSWIIVPLVLAGLVLVAGPGAKQAVTAALIFSGAGTAFVSLLKYLPGERLAGIYDVPNSLALWLVPIIVLAMWRGGRVQYLAAGLMLLALLATQSAAGLLALCTTLLIGAIVFLSGRQRRRALTGTALLLVLVTAVLATSGRAEYLLSPWITGKQNSLSVRWQLWQASADLIVAHPLLGVGLGQFEPVYQTKLHARFQQFENCKLPPPLAGSRSEAGKIENCTRPLAEYVFRDPHNWILSLWLNTGLLGLVAFVGIHTYLFWKFYRLSAEGRIRRTGGQAPLLSLLSLLIFGLADTIYWKNDLAALQWVLLALAVTRTEAVASDPQSV